MKTRVGGGAPLNNPFGYANGGVPKKNVFNTPFGQTQNTMATTQDQQWTENASQGYYEDGNGGGDDFNFVADPVPNGGRHLEEFTLAGVENG